MLALLKSEANPNVKDKEGNTPLHVCETLELMAALIQAHADPNATNQVTCRTYSTLVKTLRMFSTDYSRL
jgi:ankyrin repeat protein